MSQASQEFKLRKPLIVYLLALSFLFSPVANLSLALQQGGLANWYLPSLWVELFRKMPSQEQVLITLLPVAGILLFYQRKTSWFFSILTLLIVSIHNIVSGSNFLMAVNASILVVLYFFRFPYLDQRDHLFKGISKRFVVDMDAHLEPSTFKGKVKNISLSGCFIQFDGPAPSKGARIKIKIVDQMIDIECMHEKNNGCGFKFIDPKQITEQLLKKCQSSQ